MTAQWKISFDKEKFPTYKEIRNVLKLGISPRTLPEVVFDLMVQAACEKADALKSTVKKAKRRGKVGNQKG